MATIASVPPALDSTHLLSTLDRDDYTSLLTAANTAPAPDFQPIQFNLNVPRMTLDLHSQIPPISTTNLDTLRTQNPSLPSAVPAYVGADFPGAPPLSAYELDGDIAVSSEAIDDEPMEAFAKLQFPDGDFFVNSFVVDLGRDLNAIRHERRRLRDEKRRKDIDTALGLASVEDDAADDVDDPDTLDTPAVKSAIHSPGDVSEAGGIIGTNLYPSEDESVHSRKPRWKHLASNDSSVSHSIAPATLHNNANDFSFTSNLFSDDRSPIDNVEASLIHQPECPFIPIHPQAGTSMANISRKHIRIEYNGQQDAWELRILGRNGVWIDGEFYRTNQVAKLSHGSHILIQSILIVFNLPDNAQTSRDSPDQNMSGSDLDSSAPSDIDADDDADDARSLSARTHDHTPSKKPPHRTKLRLTFGKRSQPSSTVKDAAKDCRTSANSSENDKPATPTTIDVKQDKSQTNTDVIQSIEQGDNAKPTSPRLTDADGNVLPPQDLPIGSILAGVAPEDIPQKRKGPGRPPKNGVMSKRDEAIIKRKKKELQKLGKEIPPLADLLVMARAEAGSTKKEKGEEGHEDDEPRPSADANASAKAEVATADLTEQVKSSDNTATASLPRQSEETGSASAKKAAKSPSPQKPEAAYTEEQLKKPNKTYVILIHEALEKSSTGIMDLQQIYDAIQKLYPYYKYRSQTQGWQSSIRHNLIGSGAFEEAGKIGKGRLWKINANHPIDKERKRKVATPEPERPPYNGPYYANGQFPYTNQGYPSYRPSPYGRPYGPPNALSAGARPPPGTAQPQPQRPGTYYSPYASNQPAQTATTPYSAAGRPPYPQTTQSAQPAGSAPTATKTPNNAQTATPPSTVPHPQSRPPTQPSTIGLQQKNQTSALKPSQPPATQQLQQKPQQSTVQAQPPAQSQQSNGSVWEATTDEIMNFNKEYLRQFKGEAQEQARVLFRRAVHRHIYKNKDHGPFQSEEERVVADRIVAIIAKNRQKVKAATMSTTPASTIVHPKPAVATSSAAPVGPTKVAAPPSTASVPSGMQYRTTGPLNAAPKPPYPGPSVANRGSITPNFAANSPAPGQQAPKGLNVATAVPLPSVAATPSQKDSTAPAATIAAVAPSVVSAVGQPQAPPSKPIQAHTISITNATSSAPVAKMQAMAGGNAVKRGAGGSTDEPAAKRQKA